MELSGQTLHDFVLNLLSDSQALASFEQDPAAVLDHAGLSDISAADVQEVIPLVIDYAPVQTEALDSVLSALPLDSVDTGQLGAIQQIQYVAQAFTGLQYGASDVNGVMSVTEHFGNSVLGITGYDSSLTSAADGLLHSDAINTPLGSGLLAEAIRPSGEFDAHTEFTSEQLGFAGSGSLAASLDHGIAADMSMTSALGASSFAISVPGLDGLGVPGLDGLGLPSGFSSVSDLTNTLDGQAGLGMLTSSAGTASNLLSGATDIASGALANPQTLVSEALANPAGAVTALTGTTQAYAAYATNALPAPLSSVTAAVMHTTNTTIDNGFMSQMTSQVTDQVTSHLPGVGSIGDLGGLGNVANVGGLGHLANVGDLGHLGGIGSVTSATSTVTNVVGQVTSHMPGVGGVGDLTNHLDATQATQTVQSVTSTVQSVTGNAASHSPLGNVLGGAGTGNLLGGLDHAGLGDLSHTVSDLHLPGL